MKKQPHAGPGLLRRLGFFLQHYQQGLGGCADGVLEPREPSGEPEQE